jgi:signal peptidase II
MKEKVKLRILIIVLTITVLDLIIKAWALSALGFGNQMKLAGDIFLIVPVKNIRMSLGISNYWSIAVILDLLFKLLFLVFFTRIHNRVIADGFKWSSALILFGWIGNFIDRLLFSEGDSSYIHMDYFYDGLVTRSVTSITTAMILAGWIVLLVVTIVRFRDLKKIFAKAIPDANPVAQAGDH